MNYKFFYGGEPVFTERDKGMFSRNGYECRKLLLTAKGMPVGVSYCREMDIWKVEHGTTAVWFGTYGEAMGYCTERFTDLKGGRVHA